LVLLPLHDSSPECDVGAAAYAMNKGYTSYDFDKAETGNIIQQLL
jgi:hypothetical protein